MSLQLLSANVINFKSLGDVHLSFRDLTVIVGSNSSGKSNSLEALSFLKDMLDAGSPPPLGLMQRLFKFEAKGDVTFTIAIKREKKEAKYTVSVATGSEASFFSSEELVIGKTKVIDIKNGEGKVRDEDGKNPQKYQSKTGNLALKSTGDFGDKPFTSEIAEFIRNWDFYDLDPEIIRDNPMIIIGGSIPRMGETAPILDRRGREIQDILKYWAENDEDKFQAINEELQSCIGITLKLGQDGEKTINALEKDRLEVPLSSMSDGTLRIIAYYMLLYETKLPPLIGIEEPERNLHPGILRDVASVLKRLSKKTQVVIITHSSQLLDCFNLEDIHTDISVLLLNKKDGFGTVASPLDELGDRQNDLSDWMRDFGVGSAIYHSHLLEGILEKQYA